MEKVFQVAILPKQSLEVKLTHRAFVLLFVFKRKRKDAPRGSLV